MSESKSAPLGQHTTPSSGWTVTLRNSSGSRSGAKNAFKFDDLVERDDSLHAVFETKLETVRGWRRLDGAASQAAAGPPRAHRLLLFSTIGVPSKSKRSRSRLIK